MWAHWTQHSVPSPPFNQYSFENNPWAGLGRILAVACATAEKHWFGPCNITTALVGGDVRKCNLHFSRCICLLYGFLIRRRHHRIVNLRVLGLHFIIPPSPKGPKENVTWHAPGALFCGILSTWRTSTVTIYIDKKCKLHFRTSSLISGS